MTNEKPTHKIDVVLSQDAQEKLDSVRREIYSGVLSEAKQLAEQRKLDKPDIDKITITADDVEKAIIKVCKSVCQK